MEELEEKVKVVKKVEKNNMVIVFDAKSKNEGFARVAVSAFITMLNPTMEELSDVKTAVSEAVTNSIIHGYDGKQGKVTLECSVEGDVVSIIVSDEGKGIENIEKAMEPLFTTRPELERSGMGFSFMEAFMDDLEVTSRLEQGTQVFMKKKLGCSPWIRDEEE